MSELDTTDANLEGASVPNTLNEFSSLLESTTGEPEQPTPEVEEVTQPEGDAEPSRRVKAKLGDQEIDLEVLTEGVDLSLIPKGLMMENDYRTKTAAVAEQRRDFESKVTQADSALEDAKLMLEVDLNELEASSELRTTDPEEWIKLNDTLNAKIDKYKKAKEFVDSEREKQQQDIRTRELNLLTESIPDWLDEEVKTTQQGLMVKAMNDTGMTNEDIGAIDDHRIFLLARKAALYDQIMLKDLTAKKDKESGKSLSPGTKTTEPTLSDKAKRTREKFSKSGNVNDLANVFSQG